MAAQSISTADLLIIFLVTSCATFVTLAIWDMFFRRQEVIYVPVQAVPKQKRPTSQSRSRPRSKSKDRRPSICPTGLHTNGIYCPCRIKNKLGLNTHSPKLSKKAVNLNGNNSNNHQARDVPFFAKALERHHGQHRMVEAIIEKVLVIESIKMKNLLSPAPLRCRDVHAYAYIISHLRGQVPSLLGKEMTKKKLIAALGDVFAQLPSQYQISPDDFPNIKHNQEQHQFHDFSKFQPLKLKLLKSVDRMLAEEIAKLMAQMPREEHDKLENSVVKGGTFDRHKESPFDIGKCEAIDQGHNEQEWIVAKEQYKYDEVFATLNPVSRKITSESVNSEMAKSQLPNAILGKVWKPANIDQDGMLDLDEFALAMPLISIKLEGHDLPN